MGPPILQEIADAKEVRVVTGTGDQSTSTILWVVVVDDEVFIRTAFGDQTKWYQRIMKDPSVSLVVGADEVAFTAVSATDDETVAKVSAAYQDKYPPGRSVDVMLDPDVLHTTLRLEPR